MGIYGSSSAYKGCQEGANFSFYALLNAATTGPPPSEKPGWRMACRDLTVATGLALVPPFWQPDDHPHRDGENARSCAREGGTVASPATVFRGIAIGG